MEMPRSDGDGFAQTRRGGYACAKTVAVHLLLSVIVLCSDTSSTVASDFDFEFGHWIGRIERDAGDRAEACVVSLHNADDEMLLLRLDRSGFLSLGVFGVDWMATTSKFNDLIVAIDHNVLQTGMAIAGGNGARAFNIPNVADSLSAIAEGQKLGVIVGDQSAVFELDGAKRSIPFLLNCRTEVRRHETRQGTMPSVYFARLPCRGLAEALAIWA